MAKIGHCEVCKEGSPKYKCPICRLPYCTLTCYKKHKETECRPVELESTVTTLSSSSNSADAPILSATQLKNSESFPDDEEMKLTPQQLHKLMMSDAIHDMISQLPHLRTALKEINSSSDPENELGNALQYLPNFREFADCCIEVVGPVAK
ncbi:hypothetical protein SeMB42_g01174 [Synchytrium endobioticum]|uniref:Zinc finger HIT domain-containing protein 3 n=1 Tax=Synchytrium endobioticum TaxID=286115 RepID=A0A507DM78_9FUNG|nr:hypothetical protein SeLEV6574_g03906 [Synchytrium endobioticum]TPX52772.1 hypothetical protein SeMB42_g01174 [Synchytrium endobioticum]